jgi:hypothetical protein
VRRTSILGMFLRYLPGFSDCCLKAVSQATNLRSPLAIAIKHDNVQAAQMHLDTGASPSSA